MTQPHPRRFRPALAVLAALLALAVLSRPLPEGAMAAGPGPIPGLDEAAAGLVPHRALYKMSLESAESGSGIAGAQGAMLYRFAETCDAWTVETNIYLRLRYAESGDVDIAWSFAAVETKDGLGYRFRMTHKRNGRITEALKGTATIEAPGGAGQARFEGDKRRGRAQPGQGNKENRRGRAQPGQGQKKDGTTVRLPKGTLFPTRHLAALIGAGRGGRRFFVETVFDGASLDNPYRVSASIGGPRGGDGPRGNGGVPRNPQGPDRDKKESSLKEDEVRALFKAAGLAPASAWPVRLAFFPVRSRKPEPEFELGVDYRADGVAERIVQDYGDFSIAMRPAEIEVLDRPEC